MPDPLEKLMKIGNPADTAALATLGSGQTAGTESAKTARTQATPAAPDASATVALSTTAATLRSGGASADFDAEKVARIQQAIADGTFQVNPEAIADKLIANAQEVLGRVQRG